MSTIEHSAASMPPRSGLDSLMIERATHEHVPYLRRLKANVMEHRYRPTSDPEGFERWREVYCTEQYFHDLIDDPTAMLLCIGSLSDPVGMVVLRRMPDHLEVDDLLCLVPRQGDGTRLLISALRFAEAWRYDTVAIDVYPQQDNEEFLVGHGFAHEDDVTNDLGQPMHRYVRRIA
jgi:hypothetical protein